LKNLLPILLLSLIIGCANDNDTRIDKLAPKGINQQEEKELTIKDSIEQRMEDSIRAKKITRKKQTELSKNDCNEFEVYLKKFIEDLLTNEKRLDYYIYHKKPVFQKYINNDLGYYIAYNQGVYCDLYSENSYYGDNYDNWVNDRFEENLTFNWNKHRVKIFRNQMPKGGFCKPTDEESGFYYKLQNTYNSFSIFAEPISDEYLLSNMLWSIHEELGYGEDVFNESGTLFNDYRDPSTRKFVPKHVFDSISNIYFELGGKTGSYDDFIKKRKLISKCINVQVLENGLITYNIYFVKSNNKWHFHILDKCDCNA